MNSVAYTINQQSNMWWKSEPGFMRFRKLLVKSHKILQQKQQQQRMVDQKSQCEGVKLRL